MQMEDKKEFNFKTLVDNVLIINLYLLIFGAVFLIISFILSINGNSTLYELFRKLWYPIFIPSLSLFFTAITIEALFSQILKRKDK
tara:strand:+ start:1084 stop:1341 length:258 start_codon:yes stop_codon:yes gene_type:complete